MSIPFINDFLKRERKKRGITQEKFADMIFKSKPTIARYDKGDIISESIIRRSCDVLGIDFLTLLKGQEEESLGEFESWAGIDKHNECIEKNLGAWIDEFDSGIISPPYEKLLRKYKKELENINLSEINKNETLPISKSDYDINTLKSELNNYLDLKNNILNIPNDSEKNKEKIDKILSFIDFLYFDDIIKK